MARRSRSLARRLALPVVSTLAAAALWAPMLAHPRATGFGDWQFFHHMWEAGYVGVWRYGEWPLWDPYHCGGVTLFGNPQSQLLSPFFALALVTDTTIALKLFVLAHAAAGLGGRTEVVGVEVASYAAMAQRLAGQEIGRAHV